MVALPPQHGENTAFFSRFPLGGIHSQGILPIISLQLQGKSINHFLGHSLSSFPVGGLHSWGILLVVPLEFQKIRYQPFPMTHSLCFL